MATDATGAEVWEVTCAPFGGVHSVDGDTLALSAQEHRFPRGQCFQVGEPE